MPVGPQERQTEHQTVHTNLHVMELLRYQELQILLAWWISECPDYVDLAILTTLAVTPTIKGKMNSLCINLM